MNNENRMHGFAILGLSSLAFAMPGCQTAEPAAQDGPENLPQASLIGNDLAGLARPDSLVADGFFNWYTGGARGAEQGTHGTGMGDCGLGQVVVGIQYFEGGNSDWVDGIGVHCQSVSVSSGNYWNWYTSGERGAEQGTHGTGMGDCPFGQIVVGIQYFEGGNSDWVDGIGVHCRSVFGTGQNYWNWYTSGERGAEQGTHGTGMGDCPPGTEVVGIQYFEGGNSDWVDGIGVHCRDEI